MYYVKTLRVMLWDEEIGRLAWDSRRRMSYCSMPEYAVQDRWINTVEDAINRHLDLWGFANRNKTAVNLVINGTQYNNVRIEQTYKGNFHLYANINGAERKYVIGKNKSEYVLIQSIGVSNLSKDLLADMVEKFLCHSDYC